MNLIPNLKILKIETYVSLVCFLASMILDVINPLTFKLYDTTDISNIFSILEHICALVALIVSFHIIFALHRASHSTKLFKRFIILLPLGFVYLIGLGLATPNFSLLMGHNMIPIGFVVLFVGFVGCVIFGRLLFREIAFICDEKLFIWVFYLFVVALTLNVVSLLLLFPYLYVEAITHIIGFLTIGAIIALFAMLIIATIRTKAIRVSQYSADSRSKI